MTSHQKALIWTALIYLFALDQINVVVHSLFLTVAYFVLFPILMYVLARAIMLTWRIRIIVLPREEFTPRCLECEEKGLAYGVERVSSKVIERWNVIHEHSVQVKNSTSMECNRGHFVQFRVKPNVIVKRYTKRSTADYLRALRKGFHDMNFSESEDENLDTKAG